MAWRVEWKIGGEVGLLPGCYHKYPARTAARIEEIEKRHPGAEGVAHYRIVEGCDCPPEVREGG